MSRENVEQAREAVVAVNETYRMGDLAPWRRHVERTFDPRGRARVRTRRAFTEGEWRGLEGAIGFVENQIQNRAEAFEAAGLSE